MKRLLMSFAAGLISLCSFAQSFDYGVTAGLSVSCPRHAGTHVGFDVGMKGEFALSENDNYPYIGTGLSLRSRGWKEDLYIEEAMERKVDWKWNLNYLELPVLVGYRLTASDRAAYTVEIGPYIACGLWGSSKADGVEDMDNTKVFSDGMCRRFDYGLKFNVGYEYDRWQFQLGVSGSMQKPLKTTVETMSNPRDLAVALKLTYMLSR